MRLPLLLLGSASLLFTAPVSAAPFLTEVAWMGTDAAFGDEWIEIHNAGDTPVDLSQYELLEGNTVHSLPAVSIPPGGFVVLEDNEDATSLAPDAAVVLGMSLSNSGEELRLCPSGQTSNPSVCDVAHAGGAWPGGDNATKQTMVRTGPLVLGQEGTWETWSGPGSAVLDANGDPIRGTPGVHENEPHEPDEPDAGPGDLDAGPGDVDAGAPDELDAGPPPPHVYPGLAITEIYFNPPSSAETGKEWVEVANLSSGPIAVDGAVLERLEGAANPTVARTATIAGTGIVLSPGERVVFAQTEDLDVGVCVGGPFVVLPSSELQLANSGTQWLRITAGGVSNTVKYAGSGVPGADDGVGEGVALALEDEDLDNADPANFAPSPCAYAAGVFGSPGVRNEDCAEVGALVECVAAPDAGPPPGGETDGGTEPPTSPPDAGPNAAPIVSMSAPSGVVTSAGSVDITYTASDPDDDDVVEVSLFYDLDGANQDGVRIASGLPAGEHTYTWSTAGVPAGTYHVFAAARDLRGETSYAYAPGTIVVGGGVENDIATIALTEPDGVNDDTSTGKVVIRWEIALPEGTDGNVSLYYDTDGEGLDGEPIIAGLPVYTEAGEEGLREYVWDPGDVAPGSYVIYAVLDWTRGQASAYSAFVDVGTPEGCACAISRTGAPIEAGFLGALVLAVSSRLRRRRRARAANEERRAKVSRSGTKRRGAGAGNDET